VEYWLQISLQYDLPFPFYYGRPSSGWSTSIVKCAWCLDLFLLAQSLRSLGQSSPNFATCSMVNVVYKIALEIWGTPPLKKIGGPKISQFWRNFGQLCNLFANISGLEQDIINWKTALQSRNTPVHVYLT